MDAAQDPRVTPNLDMSNHLDRRTVRGLAARCGPRWNITPEFKEKLIACLQTATEVAAMNGNVRDMTDCVKTAAVLVGQVQADEHLADKNARLDEGKATENNKLEVVYVNRITPKID